MINMIIDDVNSPTYIRDSLALTRTILSNERTMLAYIRTGIAFFIAGAGVLRFIQDGVYVLITGWSLIVLGGIVIIWGIISYRRLRNSFAISKVSRSKF